MPRKNLSRRKSGRGSVRKSGRRSSAKRLKRYRKRSSNHALYAGYLFYPSNEDINDSVKELKRDPKTANIFENVPDNYGEGLWKTFGRDVNGLTQKAILEDYLSKTRGPESIKNKTLSFLDPYSDANVDARANERIKKGLKELCDQPEKLKETIQNGTFGIVKLTGNQNDLIQRVQASLRQFCDGTEYTDFTAQL